jgi:anthranilate synthase/aminodeoxychorismate synthase-like glutamine amidotransferase
MWILIDNYDSFTYILHHYLLELHQDVVVYKNDAISVEVIRTLKPDRIILSPGPRTPTEAGITNAVIAAFHQSIPILGICLGHQALGVFYGAALHRANIPMHGLTSELDHSGTHLFATIPMQTTVMRYHSLVIDIPKQSALQVLATADDGSIMAFQHKTYPAIGIQFHPESILTPFGKQMLANWSNMDFAIPTI